MTSRCVLCTFADFELADDASDATVWQTCQDRQVLLITGNRNAEGSESLEATIRQGNTADALPVLTLADPDRIRRDGRPSQLHRLSAGDQGNHLGRSRQRHQVTMHFRVRTDAKLFPITTSWGARLGTSGLYMAKRWQRVGVSQQYRDNLISDIQVGLRWRGRYVDTCGGSTTESPTLPSDFGRQQDLTIYYDIIQLQHLEFEHPFGDVVQYVEAISDVAVDYFCGAWRDHTTIAYEACDRAKCRQIAPWIDELREGLVGALLTRQYEHLRKLASYPDADLPVDNGCWDRTAEDKDFYVLLCSFLRTTLSMDRHAWTPPVRRYRQRRPRTMYGCLESVAEGDVRRFFASLSKLLQGFRDSELDVHYGRVVTSWDATILWNIAEMNGLEPPACAVEVLDLVMTRNSLGMTGYPRRGDMR